MAAPSTPQDLVSVRSPLPRLHAVTAAQQHDHAAAESGEPGREHRSAGGVAAIVLGAFAALRGQTSEAVAAAATANTRRFFGLS